MEVGSPGVARLATQADDLAPSHLLSRIDPELRQMGIYGEDMTGVFEPDHGSVPPLGSSKPNPPSGHGPYRGSHGNLDVHTPVKAGNQAQKANSEGGNQWAICWPSRDAASEKEEEREV